jgi:hypothetical protein
MSAAERQEAAQNRQQLGVSANVTPSEGTGLVESRRWIFCIALDDSDRVTRAGRLELQGAGSLERAVRDWAAGAK